MWSLARKSRRMTCLFLTRQSFPPIFNPSSVREPSRSIHNPLSTLSPVSRHFSVPLSHNSNPGQPTSPFATQGFRFPISSPAIRAFCSTGTGRMGDGVSQNPDSISYLGQREAAEIDEILMGPLGFSVDQLMELAGLSVATSIAEVYNANEYKRVLTICGPGNNGGDGLGAARHLHHFGYKPFVCYPKRTPKPLYSGLVTQLESLSVPFLPLEDLPLDLSKDFDILIDAMFGFSFHGTPRPPFDDLIQRLVSLRGYDQARQKFPVIVSVDIPSGWHVEDGDIGGEGIKPDMLVSLTAPKLCAKKFCGPHHFLGGRFVPPAIAEKYNLRLPPYPGTSMCVRIGKPPKVDISALRENYISPEFLEEQVEADPIDQFCKWFDDAVAAGLREPNAMALSTAGKEGKPSSRMVLLKGVDKNGFVWYTNYESRKARELSDNPHASLLFYWEGLNRQVRIEGSVQKVSDEESEQYFHSRPRGSQIGAIVSKQSTVVPGRHVLHHQYKELEEKFSDDRWSLVDLLRDDYIEKDRSCGIYFTQDWVSLPGVLPVASGGIHVWHMPALTEIFGDDSVLQFGGGTLGHPWGCLYDQKSPIPKPAHWGGYRLKPELFEFWQGQQSRLHDRLQYTPHEINGRQVWEIVRLAP